MAECKNTTYFRRTSNHKYLEESIPELVKFDIGEWIYIDKQRYQITERYFYMSTKDNTSNYIYNVKEDKNFVEYGIRPF